MISPDPQALWLEQLGRADGFAGWVFDQMRPHLAGNVLEVGCGHGTYTRLLAGAATSVVALDLEESFVRAAQAATANLDNVSVSVGDATDDTHVAEFDTVVMLDVLEHIADDAAVLRKLGRALRPGGRLIVKVPAFGWLHGAVDDAVGHHRRYTRANLSSTLEDSGFTPKRVWYFNAAAIPGWWLNGVVMRRATPPGAQLALFNKALPLIKIMDRLVAPFVGLSLFAVAQKRFERG